MAADLSLYPGREQTFIKHEFLTKYLKAAAYKTLQGVSPVFNFVDAFAGPWKISDDAKYTDASFDQAIDTLESVRIDLAQRGIVGLKLRFCFCEQRADAAARLREYAKQKKHAEIYVFEGAFEDNLDAISKVIPDGFTFTFIDPLGWNIRNEKVFAFLKARKKGEFLLNFMADHINRHAEYDKVMESIGRFLADPDWAQDFAQLPKNWSNQERVLHLLKTTMKQKGVATYLPDFSIMVPRKERVKMRLILGTHSPYGLEVFRDVQATVELQEMNVRNGLQNDKTNQTSLFSNEDISDLQQQLKGVGCKKYQEIAEDRLKSFLSSRQDALFSVVALDIMEAVPMRLTQIKKLLLELRNRKIVAFTLLSKKRVPQPNTAISIVL